MTIKTFITVVKIEMSKLDFVFHFAARGGVWIFPVNEALKESFYFYGEEINKSELITVDDVSSVTVDNNRGYVKVDIWQELYIQDSSFMFFTENGIKYIAIHFDNFSTPFSKNEIILNIALFFCDRGIKENSKTLKINKKKVEERIAEINNADIEGDALNFDTIQTNEMTVTLLNHDGLFDNFENFYGNNFTVYKLYDNESFDKAKTIYSGFIQKPEYNYLDTVAITAGDIRFTFSNTLTSKVFSLKEYPYLDKFPKNVKSGKEIIDKPRTVAAGRGVVVPLIAIKYDAVSATPEVVFEIADTSRHAIERIVEKADPLDNNKIKPRIFYIEKGQKGESIEHNGVTITGDIETIINEYKDFNNGLGLQKNWTLDKEKGIVTFRGYEQVNHITDKSDNLYELFIEIDIPPYKSLQFVRECLAEYENIAFIKQNYDIENWNNAEAQSKEIAVVINEDNDLSILDLIGKVSFLEQGRLEIRDNKITFNTTEDRVIKYKFNQNKTGRVDKTVDNAEYLSTCSIVYDLGNLTYKNTDFENEAKKRHRLNVHEDFETILKHEKDAVELSNKIMKARHVLKDYITFEYFETLDNLELFDLVEFSYKRDKRKVSDVLQSFDNYYIKPCICEVLKLNVFDNVIKLRKI